MRRLAHILPALAVLTLASSLPATGQAPLEPEQVRARFEGHWRYDGSNAQGRQVIAHAIDRGVEDMFFLARGFARGRLEDTNHFSPTLRFRFPADRIEITFEGRHTYSTPANGDWRRVTAPDGEAVSCSQRFARGRIVQVFRNDEGTRTNVFRTVGAQRLRFHVTLEADALPGPIRYHLDYRRPGSR